ncbi:3-dehydroquinate synthase [Thermoanaerobacter mathranii subsp. mathranii str. A3]|uniref:3-dehydroquinate synthase n=2 Tax=Thermoanaerobacter TaxID=1754 RepID=D3T8G0_THEIA|nr:MULTISPECIES: 3-dehydroquinate synthase [Thermoanaerobacter]ADD02242.1 3-dehydroquinate synthase [Thermoanaerobacter italicus Ab9]ADH60748.1 3-dehydroquinate synthase [Thermoanaerobacter mathranii subsp. mathranii str. A3]KUJ90550.1 MAG: 3-dehydroquinate synthase [Thermoanaerobacter thermocopriae]
MDFITVDLKEKSYPIYFAYDSFDKLGEIVKKHVRSSKTFIITDSIVYPLYFEKLNESLTKSGFNVSYEVIPPGEPSKTMEMAQRLLEKAYDNGLLRDSSVIALGGGVVGDIAGFVAATYMRGIDFVQIPTTLLAQVDSSVGGKVGVNLKKGKNIVGAFYQPKMVYIDISVLKTINKREILGGLAEIIKYGIIWDFDLFEYIENNLHEILNLKEDKLTHIIKKSCEIKGKIVSLDEKEENLRSILNFGHTVGHAIEALTGYQKYIHGEAVAIGMVYACKLALDLGYINEKYFERIFSLIQKTGLPTDYEDLPKENIVEAIKLDKKSRESKINFVLPSGFGKVEVISVKKEEILKVLK